DLRIQHVRACPEVDHVQDGNVLSQLLIGEVEIVTQLSSVKPQAGPPRVDQDAREGHEPSEALGTDRSFRMVAVPRLGFGLVLVTISCVRRRRNSRGRYLGLAGVSLDQQRDSLAQLARQLRWPEDPRVLAESQHPGD